MILAIVLALVAAHAPRAAGDDEERIESAVVAVEVTAQPGDWYTPWQRSGIVQLTGSGFIVAKGHVMTNAHVVSDAKQIVVRHEGDSTPFFAHVDFIAHDSDLALLQVDDPEFDKGVTPLPIGELPTLRTHVRTYGFPAGGEKISRTEGIVSRIQFITYVHSGADSHLAIQTDSAINPGNSGGPVMQDGKVVGVAFQANPSLSDVGFFIPTTVIRRFLADIADGRYDGYAELGLRTSNLINSAYRKYLKLPDDRSGVVVDAVMPGSSCDGLVQPDDVLMAIGQSGIGDEGNILYRGFTMGFEQIAEERQVGDTLPLTIWRNGKEIRQEIKLRGLPDANRMRSSFDAQPHYIVYAGLVFLELDREYLETFGNFWDNATDEVLYEHFFSRPEHPERYAKHAVVLSRILPDEVNSAYRGAANSIVSKINGVEIDGLASIPGALAKPQDGYHIIQLGDVGQLLILNKAQADAAHPQILKHYGVGKDRRLN